MTRTFDPWVGSLYASEGLDGLKLLVLGESHYGTFESEAADKTTEVVRSQGRGKRYRLFTITAKMVLGRGSGGSFSDSECAAFGDRVAFANYIQSFPTEDAKSQTRPTNQMWTNAREPFLETLREIRPHAVLVLGLDMFKRLPALPTDVVAKGIKHPSRFSKYAVSQPVVQKLIADARAGAGLPAR